MGLGEGDYIWAWGGLHMGLGEGITYGPGGGGIRGETLFISCMIISIESFFPRDH